METFEQFRKRERREAEAAAKQAAETQRSKEAAAKQAQIEAQRKAAQMADYRKYWLYTMKRPGDARPVNLQTWLRFGADVRQRALELIEQGGFVEITERE